jgi:hypothetical protein
MVRATPIAEQFTPGPWKRRKNSPHLDLCAPVTTKGENIADEALVTIHPKGGHGHDEALANLHLIAAAPDHALIGWAMCVAAGRWEPWGDGRGEFVINGIRHVTRLDQFGIPEVTPALRDALAKARGEQVQP